MKSAQTILLFDDKLDVANVSRVAAYQLAVFLDWPCFPSDSLEWRSDATSTK